MLRATVVVVLGAAVVVVLRSTVVAVLGANVDEEVFGATVAEVMVLGASVLEVVWVSKLSRPVLPYR